MLVTILCLYMDKNEWDWSAAVLQNLAPTLKKTHLLVL